MGDSTKPKPITAAGQTKTAREWSEQGGICPTTIRIRLRRGWTPEQAVGLAMPPANRPGRKTSVSLQSDYQSRKMAEKRRHARALAICLECYAEKAAPARTKCPTCLLADSIRHQKAA